MSYLAIPDFMPLCTYSTIVPYNKSRVTFSTLDLIICTLICNLWYTLIVANIWTPTLFYVKYLVNSRC